MTDCKTESGNTPLDLEGFKTLQPYINIVNGDVFPTIDNVSDDFPPALLEAWQHFHQAKQALNVRLEQHGVDKI